MGHRYCDISLIIAQSALRCSWADLSTGARGSTVGLGVKVSLAGAASPCFEAPSVAVDEVEDLDGEAGVLGASRGEGVVVNARPLESAVLWVSHGLCHWSCDREQRTAGCADRGSNTDRNIIVVLVILMVMLARSARVPFPTMGRKREQLISFHPKTRRTYKSLRVRQLDGEAWFLLDCAIS